MGASDLAWCAGFLDGEGSFMLCRVTGTDRRCTADLALRINLETQLKER